MPNDINSLETILLFLENRGYEATLTENAVLTRVGSFPTVITIDDVDGDGDPDIKITTQLTTLGQIREDRVPAFLTAALDLNTRILPFAVATLTAEDGEDSDPSTFPVVLIDSIPVGDVSEEEFDSAFGSLLQAILGTRQLLEIGFGTFEAPQEEIQLRRSQFSRSQLTRIARSFRGRDIGPDFDVEDLLDILVEISFLVDDGFFFGEEPIVEDPLANDEPQTNDEPAVIISLRDDDVAEEPARFSEPAPSVEESSTRSSWSDSSSSFSDSGSSDSGSSDCGSSCD